MINTTQDNAHNSWIKQTKERIKQGWPIHPQMDWPKKHQSLLPKVRRNRREQNLLKISLAVQKIPETGNTTIYFEHVY